MQSYLQALFTLMLPAEDMSAFHQEGERVVISELVRIQSDLRAVYRRMARLVADPSDPGTNATGSCLAAPQ